MSEVAANTQAPIQFADSAAARVRTLAAQHGGDARMLRVYIQGGGCSGFEYGFDFADAANDDDTIVENGGVKVIVDPLSLQYLSGATIEYIEDLQGARFVVANPNAATTCGCGSSFSV